MNQVKSKLFEFSNILPPMETLGSRVKAARLDAKLSQEALARQVGVSQGLIGQIESGKNQGSKHLAALARALGVSADWLETGKGPRERAVGQHKIPEDQGNVLVWEHPDDLPPDENRVWLDRYDYRFSAGTGLIQWEVRQKKELPFDMGFFRALGVKPQDCKLVQVHGRSMEPYLFNRDLMMICTTRVHLRDGHIYAVYFEDEALVKQIFKEPDGGLRLHSYNPEFPDRFVKGDQLTRLQIAGEVMYRSGSGPAGGN